MGKDHTELIQNTKPMGIQVTPVAQINLLEPYIAFIDRVW